MHEQQRVLQRQVWKLARRVLGARSLRGSGRTRDQPVRPIDLKAAEASTRPTGSSTSVDTPVSSTEPTGGSRVTSRRSHSSSSSSRLRTTPLSGTSCSSPGTRSGKRRTGGSRSSAAASSLPLLAPLQSARPPRVRAPRSAGSSRAQRLGVPVNPLDLVLPSLHRCYLLLSELIRVRLELTARRSAGSSRSLTDLFAIRRPSRGRDWDVAIRKQGES